MRGMSITNLVYVALGGALGAVARYVIAARVTAWYLNVSGWAAPAGTLFVNVTGSLLLGFFLEWSLGRFARGTPVHLLISAGFFGAYTTYSTFAVESIAYLRAGAWLPFTLNVVVTTVACLGAALVGVWLAQAITR